MKIVRMIRGYSTPNGNYSRGNRYEVSEEQYRRFVELGCVKADPADPPKEAPKREDEPEVTERAVRKRRASK